MLTQVTPRGHPLVDSFSGGKFDQGKICQEVRHTHTYIYIVRGWHLQSQWSLACACVCVHETVTMILDTHTHTYIYCIYIYTVYINYAWRHIMVTAFSILYLRQDILQTSTLWAGITFSRGQGPRVKFWDLHPFIKQINVMIYEGFHKWGYPNSWMVTTILGSLYMMRMWNDGID